MTSANLSCFVYPNRILEARNDSSLESISKSLCTPAQEANSISNKTVVPSQCPLINDLFTVLGTSIL